MLISGEEDNSILVKHRVCLVRTVELGGRVGKNKGWRGFVKNKNRYELYLKGIEKTLEEGCG